MARSGWSAHRFTYSTRSPVAQTAARRQGFVRCTKANTSQGKLVRSSERRYRHYAITRSADESSHPYPAVCSATDTSEPERPSRIPDSNEGDDLFKRPALLALGFRGFVRFKGVDLHAIPTGAGVYVVLRETDTLPRFLERNPAGRFKGKDPTVPVDELTHDWSAGRHCVYVGTASLGSKGKRGLQQRIREFRQYGDGKAVAHWGGRRIWQLCDADDYILAWLPTRPDECEDVESTLLAEFGRAHGRLPIGNLKAGTVQE